MSSNDRNVLSLKNKPDSDRKSLTERLHKVMANAGLGSRRMLEKRIRDGEVSLNGATAELGNSVSGGDRVAIDGRDYVVATDLREDARVIALNKPEGVLTTRDDPEGRATVFDELSDPPGGRWIAVGRLDTNTSGLLLLTTDGELANALMHPSSEVDREYLCRVQGDLPDGAIEKLTSGIELEDGPARFEQVIAIDSDASHSWFRVVIREGRNREVRRMFEALGCDVARLKRIRYGCITLPRRLKRGDSLDLQDGAINELRQLGGIGQPSPALTLKPVSHQRRARRSQTEIKPSEKTPSAWTGSYHNEGRELTAWDRAARPESTGRRGKPAGRRGSGGKEINGNVLKPDKPGGQKRRKSRRKAAPGQELPSVRSWFAGDDRPGAGPGKRQSNGNRGKPGGGKPGNRGGGKSGNRGGGNRGNRGNRNPD
ncbi:MAG: pseudouridine synthase [Rhodanobacteraceae bacterium]